MVDNYRIFRYWCCKVLPLVYEDSLSYYEVLCKVVKYINDLVEQDKVFSDEIDNLRKDVTAINEWMANFDTSYAEKVIRDCIATMIFIEISDAGYFIYNIPESWNDIVFNTTGLDISLALQPEYGHLVLSY